MVLIDGTVIELGGDHLDAPGYDLLGLIIGSEGQLGVVTEATVRILHAAGRRAARAARLRLREAAGACVAAIIAAGIIPVAIEFMDKPAIEVCEAFAHAGYPLDVEAMLIVEVEGCEAEIADLLGRIVEIADIAFGHGAVTSAVGAAESAAIWKGRKSAFGAMGRIADYLCMDGVIPTGRLPEVLRGSPTSSPAMACASPTSSTPATATSTRWSSSTPTTPSELRKAEAAGADILKLCVEAGGCLTGEHGVGIEKRDLMRHQFSDVDLAQQMRVKSVFDPGWLLNPSKVFPLDGGSWWSEETAMCWMCDTPAGFGVDFMRRPPRSRRTG